MQTRGQAVASMTRVQFWPRVCIAAALVHWSTGAKLLPWILKCSGLWMGDLAEDSNAIGEHHSNYCCVVKGESMVNLWLRGTTLKCFTQVQ